jgi:serine/threonine-protein kinase
MTESDLPTTRGTVIAGKYRVEAVIGEGGMGAIVRARHIALNRDVAIKLMRNEISGVHKASERFLREARATANIESDYVAHVSDIDVLPSGIPFIVMEFLDGVDLATHVAAKRQRDVTESVDWILQTLSGLAAAHELGIVHRDLKPTNLFLAKRADGSRRIKVLDFGVSKVLDDSDFSREGHNDGLTTTSNFVVGTPRYMAPEQITAPRDVDERADLWAVGLILYEFLVGAHPFDGKTPGAIMGHVLATPILPIDSFRADVPLELAKVVEHCLQRDRTKRISSAHDLLKALAPFGSPRLSASLIAALPPPSIRPQAPQAPFVAGGFAAVKPERATRDGTDESANTALQGSAALAQAAGATPPMARDAATVHTPSGISLEAAGPASVPVLLERSQAKPGVSTPLTGSPASGNTPAGVAPSSSQNADPGTLNAWHQEQRREGSRLAWVFGGVTLVGALGLVGWFYFAQQSSESDYSPTQSEPTGTQPPANAVVAPSRPEPAAEPVVADPPAVAQAPADAPLPSASAAPRVVPLPPTPVAPAPPPPKAELPPKTALSPKSKAKPKAADTAAPAPAPAPEAPAVSAPPAPDPTPAPTPQETRPSKDSILGTRN